MIVRLRIVRWHRLLCLPQPLPPFLLLQNASNLLCFLSFNTYKRNDRSEHRPECILWWFLDHFCSETSHSFYNKTEYCITYMIESSDPSRVLVTYTDLNAKLSSILGLSLHHLVVSSFRFDLAMEVFQGYSSTFEALMHTFCFLYSY